MFYCHPLEDAPFNLSKKDTGQMRDIMMRIPRYVDLTIATDGGKKFKVGSSDQTLWEKSCNIQMIRPILSKLIFKCCSEEWLKKSFYLLKVQGCEKSREFLNRYKRLEVFKPDANECTIGITEEVNIQNDKELVGKILPWLPSRNIERFRELRSKNPKTLYIFPRFHFSYMNPGSYILPHLDRSNKLLSMMLYLPTERQRGEKQLSTLFHQGNQSKLIRYEGNNAVDKNNLHRFLQSYETTTATYSDVNLIIFARSKYSWHSVDYPGDLALGSRLSININLELSNLDKRERNL